MTVGERIKEVREKICMSQVDFADKINVSKQTLYKYENNLITNIPSDKIEAAAKLGGVSPAYLMGWEEIDSHLTGREASDEVYRKFVKTSEKAGIPERIPARLISPPIRVPSAISDKAFLYCCLLSQPQDLVSPLLSLRVGTML